MSRRLDSSASRGTSGSSDCDEAINRRKPLVSVLVPCHNAKAWIQDAVESVLGQTYRAIEVIVVDDGSEDGSARRVEALRSSRVRVIRQSKRGAAAARNRALELAHGDLVQYLDADDAISPDKIALQVERLCGRDDLVASGTWARFWSDTSEAIFTPNSCWRDLDPVTWLVESWSGRGDGGMLASWLIPRRIVEKAGPWCEPLRLNIDGEYMTRVLLAAKGVAWVEGAKCFYRSGISGSISRGRSRDALESWFTSLVLCEVSLLSRENSERTRMACSRRWHVLAHACYPYAPDIANHAVKRARRLHPFKVRPDGGPVFRVLSSVVGWRLARCLQRASGRR